MSFAKYQRSGAYHWREISGSVRSRNLFTLARYQLVLDEVADGGVIVDLGGGDGVLSYLLARKTSARVVAIDPSHLGLKLGGEMLRSRGMRSRVSLLAASGYEVPLADRSVDAVVCAEVIEHVDEPERLVAEIHRILKPGGRVVLSTPYRLTEEPIDPEHVREFYPTELSRLLAGWFPDVQVRSGVPAALVDLYTREIRGRAYFRYALNLLSLAGLNVLRVNGFRWNVVLLATATKAGSIR